MTVLGTGIIQFRISRIFFQIFLAYATNVLHLCH